MTRTKYHEMADRSGIALRTLADVTSDLDHAKTLEAGTDKAMARLMLKFGRLTKEARAYVQAYPQ